MRTVRKSGTFAKSGDASAEVEDDNDTSPLRRGAIIVVEDFAPMAATIRRQLDPTGRQTRIHVRRSLRELRHLIHPASGRDGRPRIRAIVSDCCLDEDGRESGIEVVRWLSSPPVYPRTPILLYTAHDTGRIERMCRARDAMLEDASAIPSESWEPGSEQVRRALLGFVRISEEARPIPVLHKVRTQGALLRYWDVRFFIPWDDRCIDVRRWLLARVVPGVGVKDIGEHLWTFLDAYFESMGERELEHARNLKWGSVRQYVKKVAELWGTEIDVLKARWERDTFGRGSRSTGPLPWAHGSPGPSASLPTHSRRPSARARR